MTETITTRDCNEDEAASTKTTEDNAVPTVRTIFGEIKAERRFQHDVWESINMEITPMSTNPLESINVLTTEKKLQENHDMIQQQFKKIEDEQQMVTATEQPSSMLEEIEPFEPATMPSRIVRNVKRDSISRAINTIDDSNNPVYQRSSAEIIITPDQLNMLISISLADDSESDSTESDSEEEEKL